MVFVRPVERVGTIIDILKSCKHSSFPVIDTKDDNVLYGTITSRILCKLLKQRCFGQPTRVTGASQSSVLSSDHIEHHGEEFVPLVSWEEVEGSYPKYPSVKEIRVTREERDCWMDLRPFSNSAPITVQETASVSVRSCALNDSHSPPFVCSVPTRYFVASACDFYPSSTNAIKSWE